MLISFASIQSPVSLISTLGSSGRFIHRQVVVRNLFWCLLCPACVIAAGLNPAQSALAAPIAQDATDEEATTDESTDAIPGIEGLQEPPAIRDESDAIDPTNKDALAWYMSGQKALKRGDLEAAEEAFRKSSEADPKSAVPMRALAIVLFRMNKPEAGLKKAGEAMELDPNDYQTRMELAVLYGTNRRFPEAGQLLREALKSDRLDPKSQDFVRTHQVRAAVALESRNLGDAADSYEVILKALERPEDFGMSEKDHKAMLKNRLTSYEVTGRVLLEASRVSKAIQAFEALSQAEDGKPGEHNLLLARAYFLQDKQSDCEKNLNIYFETGRRNRDSLVLLRDLYEASDRNDSLVPRLQELITDASDQPQVRMYLGETLLDKGLIDEAAMEYQAILDENGQPSAYVGLARVEIARKNARGLLATVTKAANGRITLEEILPLATSVATSSEFSKAIVETCRELYEDKPDSLHPFVTYFSALVAKQTEDLVQEGELLKATLELNPERELALLTLEQYGTNQLQQNEFAKAARLFEQILSTPQLSGAERVNTLYKISIVYGALEDLGAARRALTEALRMLPNEPQLLGRLAQIEAVDGKLDRAQRLLEQAVESSADRVEQLTEYRLMLASVFAQLREWEKAQEQYQFVLDTEPLDAETSRMARMGLSNAFVQGGDMSQGEKVLEEIYEEDSSDPGINNDLGYLYADQGKNLEQALKMIQMAVAAQPENPAYLDSLGWVLFKLGRHEEALEQLRKANENPDYQDSTLLEHQGDVHEALKQMDEAVALWKKSLEVEQKSKRPDSKVLDRLNEKLKKNAPEAAVQKAE